jgi:hypothetical protein
VVDTFAFFAAAGGFLYNSQKARHEYLSNSVRRSRKDTGWTGSPCSRRAMRHARINHDQQEPFGTNTTRTSFMIRHT